MVYNKRIMKNKGLRWSWARPAIILALLALLSGTLGEESRMRNSRSLELRAHFHSSERSMQNNINYKPEFKDCATYKPEIDEEKDPGTFVIQVKATYDDPDATQDRITYSLLAAPGENIKFEINNVTGVIKTKKKFDRDEPTREKEINLSIMATDRGSSHLYNICPLKVIIRDINDNSPIFDRTNYTGFVPEDLKVNREVMRVTATDIDDKNNSVIQYELFQNTNESYFMIDQRTGVISLRRSVENKFGDIFKMLAKARDMGEDPGETEISIYIRVLESNKKAPTFVSRSKPDPIELEENFNDGDKTILELKAQSNIPDHPKLLYTLLTGNTEKTNNGSHFVLESQNNVAHIKLARDLDYERITEYCLTVEAINDYNLAAETSVFIKVLDVNDEVPIFDSRKNGGVFENQPPGTTVMQVSAIDHDGTSKNNIVKYELASNNDSFAIDPNTGNITTLKMLDREKNATYNLKIVAYDNSPSSRSKTGAPNKSQQEVRIEVVDTNDNPPKFTQNIYVATAIPENANINAGVIDIKAEDLDTESKIEYRIIDGNIGEAFSIERSTGRIYVNNLLDFETMTHYNLTVLASDGTYEDRATVKIFIDNVNDNQPVFYKFKDVLSLVEEKPQTGCITTVTAYDPDIPDRNADQKITYFIKQDDQKPFMDIDKTGCLRLKKPLDRDPPNGRPEWSIIILARDDDSSPQTSSQYAPVNITLIDINDNAPFLTIEKVVWNENQRPGQITNLTANDYDSEENGPPFNYNIDSTASDEIKDKFKVVDDKLYAKVEFDREEKKSYIIPIEITDSGEPPMTGTSMLTVIIGDVNDNPMKQGESSIFVYNCEGLIPETDIGRVYVDDPDDWDLPYKNFEWLNEQPQHFGLSSDGMIEMFTNTPEGNYHLKFSVTERASEVIDEHSVNAFVNVTVKNIPKEAVMKSVSIRFYGMTDEDFIAPNNYEKNKRDLLQEHLASMLNTSINNVDVFTVLHSPHSKNKSLLDVRFSAHGSPYYSPEKMNTIIAENFKIIERDLHTKIMMINIDECIFEGLYCNDTCRNVLNIDKKPASVFTNTSSFVGVKAIIDPHCDCQEKTSVCLNGGTPVGHKCECPPTFEGPNCELLDVSFRGDGWAVMPKPNLTCQDPQPEGKSEMNLGINLKPDGDGLVFYYGPMIYSKILQVQDFMSLEIEDGYAVLLVDYGSGTVQLKQTGTKLTDGREHRIEISWTESSIEMMVDGCGQPCMSLAGPNGTNKYLDVNSPMQIGGSFMNLQDLSRSYGWKYTPTDDKFSGCIRNMTVNSFTYDFQSMPRYKNAHQGCNLGIPKAITFAIDSNFLIAIIVCTAILLILLLAVVVHRRKRDDLYKDIDDIRENIINYEDEGGGEVDTGYDLNVLRPMYDALSIDPKMPPIITAPLNKTASDEVPDICGFLGSKKESCDKDPDTNPFDDVRHYAYEGEGNSDGSLSSLASCTDDGDLKFNYLSNFGPRFRKLADMYGEEPSDEDSDGVEERESESWC